jgi:intracellular sulfur oxidation DsrE/DsrF family protein
MFSNTRRTSVVALAVAAAALAIPVTAQAQPAKQKLVIQVSDSDPGKWRLALNNVKNVQDDLGGPDAVDIEVVVYGPGIGMLKADSAVATQIASALKNEVKVVACENTMQAQKLVYADMLPAIGYVPAGVVELMKKQQQGYAYIRP